MLQISIKALLAGIAGAGVLAVLANAFALPAWSIYVLFVGIIAITAVLQGQDNDARRAIADKRPHASA